MKSHHYLPLLVLAVTLMAATKSPFKKKQLFSYVPSGTLQLENSDEQSVMTFYMASTEITNGQYRAFLKDLKAQGLEADVQRFQVQEQAWEEIDGYNEPLAKNYFKHPSYDEYPVVNVTYEAAQRYCEWLEDKYNALLEGIQVKVRLPQKSEWIYAAKGGREIAPFPWGGFYVKNAKGCYLANFNPEEGYAEDGGFYTVKADAYFPNDYGLYNMSGNVAEMTSENGIAMGGSWMTEDYNQIRTDSEASYNKAQPSIGFRPVLSVSSSEENFKFDPNKVWKKIIKTLE